MSHFIAGSPPWNAGGMKKFDEPRSVADYELPDLGLKLEIVFIRKYLEMRMTIFQACLISLQDPAQVKWRGLTRLAVCMIQNPSFIRTSGANLFNMY